jgi:cytochrome b
LAILSVLLVQASTGLISDDEITNQGPLTSLVSGDWVSLATAWHTQLGKLLVLVLAVIHVVAIVVYKLKKGVSLVPPMIHGDKTLDQPAPASADGWRERLWALALLAWSSALVWSLVHLADGA